MAVCLIGLGSNLGDRRETLRRAVGLLERRDGLRLTGQSDWIETLPVGGPAGQRPFLNGVVRGEASLDPQSLLAWLWRIERELGRRRTERWAARTVDLDLLLYGDRIIQTPTLTVPHPGMVWRRFVLAPAAQIAPSLVHPTTGWTIARLLEHLNNTKPYVAIAGLGARRLAEQLARRPSTRWIAAPTGQAAAGQIEWLDQWIRLLERDSPIWSEPVRLWVSDFWFDQPPPDARQSEELHQRWSDARRRLEQPKLTVLLQTQTDQALAAMAIEPGHGPVLRVSGADDRVLSEVTSVVEALAKR